MKTKFWVGLYVDEYNMPYLGKTCFSIKEVIDNSSHEELEQLIQIINYETDEE